MLYVPPHLCQPLHVDTNISYDMDMSKFPGLDDPQQMNEPALLIATEWGDFCNGNDVVPSEDVVDGNGLLPLTVSSDLDCIDPVTYQYLVDDVTQDISSCDCFDFLDACADTDSVSPSSTSSDSDLDSAYVLDFSPQSPEPLVETGHSYLELPPFSQCVEDLPPFSQCVEDRHGYHKLPPISQFVEDGHGYHELPSFSQCVRDRRHITDEQCTAETAKRFKMADVTMDQSCSQMCLVSDCAVMKHTEFDRGP